MGENDLVKLHVAAAHVNPGNWTYTEGWEPMLRAYAKIMNEATELRDKAALEAKIARLESATRFAWLGLTATEQKLSLAGLGGILLLTGAVTLRGWRRRKDE
jgi:hydroxylamine dehydrogenase